ncbi:MAG: hypothetical protein IKN53_04700 [Oscillibacter sp.]|nr:hypothetical protein [Oscillibacter sp.]
MEKNVEKQERYTVLKTRRKRALAGGFWLEACMIEYAIMEDRTSSILYYGKVCKDPYSVKKMLRNKLNAIDTQIGKKHPILSKKVDRALIAEIGAWIENRNDMVHRACTLYDEDAAKELAEWGKLLSDRLDNASKRVRNAAEKA